MPSSPSTKKYTPTSSTSSPTNTDDIYQLSFSSQDLVAKIRSLLTPTGYDIGSVIWEDGESEVVVHLGKMRLALKPGLALFEVHLEADGTGIIPLVIPFKIGSNATSASLIISTEHLPRGERLMAHHWGEIVQEHVWFALLEAGEQFKTEKYPQATIQISGIFSDGKQLSYLYSDPVTVDDIKAYVKAVEDNGVPPKDDNPPAPIVLDHAPTDPTCSEPPSEPPHAEPPAPTAPASVLIQLWHEWLALILQTFRFAKKLAWVVVQISKKIKKNKEK